MKAGFTLVEVLVVLVILGLAAGVAVPPLLDVASSRESPGVEKLFGLVRSARARAVTRAEPTELIVDPIAGRYWITAERTPESPVATGPLAVEPGEIMSTQPRLSLRWDARGRMYGDSILLRTPRGVRVIGADHWTGTPYLHVR